MRKLLLNTSRDLTYINRLVFSLLFMGFLSVLGVIWSSAHQINPTIQWTCIGAMAIILGLCGLAECRRDWILEHKDK